MSDMWGETPKPAASSFERAVFEYLKNNLTVEFDKTDDYGHGGRRYLQVSISLYDPDTNEEVVICKDKNSIL